MAGLSGERGSLNNVYVLLPIKLNMVALGAPLRCCLLKKPVPPVPHKFLISRVCVSSKVSIFAIAVIFGRFLTFASSSPLSCIRFIANQSTWYENTHKCARSQCQPLVQYTTQSTNMTSSIQCSSMHLSVNVSLKVRK